MVEEIMNKVNKVENEYYNAFGGNVFDIAMYLYMRYGEIPYEIDDENVEDNLDKLGDMLRRYDSLFNPSSSVSSFSPVSKLSFWLWYSTTDNWYGWLKTDKIKVDLYKIDYNMKETVETKCSSLITKNVDPSKSNSCLSSATPCGQEQMIYESCVADVNPNNIAVSLVASHEFDWDSGDSPALYNPRVFVRRSAKQELLLPIETKTMLEEWTRENNWKYKYDTFIWLKWLSIKSSTALIKEILSENFVDFGRDDYYYWNFDAARVGYIEDIYYFLDNWFAAFIRNGKVATIGTL